MVETLSKFGVPLGGGDGRGGIIQPKQKHKCRVRFVGFGPISGGIELTQQIQSIGKPSITHNEVVVDSYNSKAYFQGKHEWAAIEVALRDNVTNDVSKLVGYQEQKQINHFEQTSPLAGINYKFSMFIEQMDGGNDAVIDQWVIEGCWLTNITYDTNDYSDDEKVMITLSVRYDNATHSDGLFPSLPIGIPGVRT